MLTLVCKPLYSHHKLVPDWNTKWKIEIFMLFKPKGISQLQGRYFCKYYIGRLNAYIALRLGVKQREPKDIHF